MNSYDLSRNFFNWTFENPEKATPGHIAVYFFAIDQCNRLGWKEKFGFPSSMAMEAVHIKSYNTYIKILRDLVEWGFIKMIEQSKNQYSANIIALSNFDKALDKALDKATSKHLTKQIVKQRESTVQSIDSINNQINNRTNKQIERSKPSNVDEVVSFFKSIGLNGKSEAEAHKFFNHFESNGWLVSGKSKMKNWEAAARNWASRIPTYNPAQKTAKKEIIYPSK